MSRDRSPHTPRMCQMHLDGEVGSRRGRSAARPAHSDDAETIERVTRGEGHKPIRKYAGMKVIEPASGAASTLLWQGRARGKLGACIGRVRRTPLLRASELLDDPGGSFA
jgi:hypothetical protein